MDDAGDSIHRGRNRQYFIHSPTHKMKQNNILKNGFIKTIKRYLGPTSCFVLSNKLLILSFRSTDFAK